MSTQIVNTCSAPNCYSHLQQFSFEFEGQLLYGPDLFVTTRQPELFLNSALRIQNYYTFGTASMQLAIWSFWRSKMRFLLAVQSAPKKILGLFDVF